MYKVTRETMEVKFSDREEADNFLKGMDSQGWKLINASFQGGEEMPLLYIFDKWHVKTY